MTREEEIKAKSKEYLPDILDDEYPYKAEFVFGFQEGAKWADKTMIEKFSKWIESTDIDMEYWNSEDGVCTELLIEGFKKAMES